MAIGYRAVEVSAPGQLTLVERSFVEPGPGQVRIRVEAAGVYVTLTRLRLKGLGRELHFRAYLVTKSPAELMRSEKALRAGRWANVLPSGGLVATAVNARLVGGETSLIVQIRLLQGLPRTEAMRRSSLPKPAPLLPCRII